MSFDYLRLKWKKKKNLFRRMEIKYANILENFQKNSIMYDFLKKWYTI